MESGTYRCGKCRKEYEIRKPAYYKKRFYLMVFVSALFAIFIITIPLLLITVPFAYHFHRKKTGADAEKARCPACGSPMKRADKNPVPTSKPARKGK